MDEPHFYELLNGRIASADRTGPLPDWADRDYWVLQGTTIVVDQAAKLAALEAEVQESADEITQNGDRDVAMALATVDLVMAARDGDLNGFTRSQIRSAYRDRVVFYLRQKRGLS